MSELPEGWRSIRMRYLLLPTLTTEQEQRLIEAEEVNFVPMEAIGEQGELDLSVVRPISEVSSGYTQFFDNDVIVAKITPCFENGKGACVSRTRSGVAFGTTELYVLHPKPEVHPKYLYYVTASPQFRRQGEGEMKGAAGQQRVPHEYIHNFQVALPSQTEQRAIAQHLDIETTKIDALIAAKQRLLDRLGEKRSALIAHAVTHGTSRDALMVNHGPSWIGQMPSHWETERAKWLFNERDERSTTGNGELLTVSHLTGVTRRSEKDVNMFMAESLEGYKKCRQGDLVINTMWAWMGAMGVAPIDGLVSPSYNVYTPTGRLNADYVDALVRTSNFIKEVTRFSKGVWSSRLRLYPAEFFDIILPVPPLDEQHAIVADIAQETAKLDALRKTTEGSIALLKERRDSLIAAAVTGKLNIEMPT